MFSKILFACVLALTTPAFAADPIAFDEESGIEELNPFAPNVGDYMDQFDVANPQEADLGNALFPATTAGTCYQTTCAIFVDISKSTQTLRLYLDGRLTNQWLVSTGAPGHSTPDFNKQFEGNRIYRRYSSSKYPGGDYRGLGNMPYAMFISGGFALHGTPSGNWRNLGRRASHGCIRIHPDQAAYINSILRKVGAANSWVTVR